MYTAVGSGESDSSARLGQLLIRPCSSYTHGSIGRVIAAEKGVILECQVNALHAQHAISVQWSSDNGSVLSSHTTADVSDPACLCTQPHCSRQLASL